MLTSDETSKILQMHEDISIYSPWSDGKIFQRIIDELSAPYIDSQVDKVVGPEARGFILGSAVAYKLNAGFVLIRKENKMFQYDYPRDLVYLERCIDYSGKEKGLEIDRTASGIEKGDRVLIIDDWFGTGGQGMAAIKLVEQVGGEVVGVGIILDDMSKEIQAKFKNYNLHSLIRRDPDQTSDQ